MLVELQVPVQDLIHCLFAANFNNVVSLGQLVENSDFSGLLTQSTDAERGVTPPRRLEAGGVPVRIWHQRRDVEVSPHWAVVPQHVGRGVNCHLRLLGVLVQPVRNVGTCGLDHWLSRFKMDVLLDQLG